MTRDLWDLKTEVTFTRGDYEAISDLKAGGWHYFVEDYRVSYATTARRRPYVSIESLQLHPELHPLCRPTDAMAEVGGNWERVALRVNEGREGWEDAMVGCLKDVRAPLDMLQVSTDKHTARELAELPSVKRGLDPTALRRE